MYKTSLDVKNRVINEFPSVIKNKQPISILILNTPCNGFGDIIFAVKLKRYLEKWYPFATISIATTKTKSFISLGESDKSLIQLDSASHIEECRRFKHLVPTSPLSVYDLIFVAPLQADFKPSLSDIRYLISYADSYNTYFFSEYNDYLDKKFDFHTGIGKGRSGMFFVDVTFKPDDMKIFLGNHKLSRNHYSVCYIAETIDKSRNCYMSFFEMISKKYKNNVFTIVVPEWIANDFSKLSTLKMSRILSYFSNIVVTTKQGSTTINKNKNEQTENTLYIRGDIFPIANKDMLILLKNSANDILLTGDQSITDALSCCPQKNIWYQIAPWKQDYANWLATLLPNKYYKNKKTSCGTIAGISLKSDYKEFVKTWDFRKIAKRKMSQIVNLALQRKYE